jgi:hypothetical protein
MNTSFITLRFIERVMAQFFTLKLCLRLISQMGLDWSKRVLLFTI